MERLTIRLGNLPPLYRTGDERGISPNYIGMKSCQQLLDRLAAYEDTGLAPEEIVTAKDRRHNCKIECLLQEYNKLCAAIGNEDGIVTPEDIEHIRALREAEADGRLMVPLCEVGDTVYIVERDEDGKVRDISGYMFLAQTCEAVICSAYIDDLESVEETLQYHIDETVRNYDTDLAVFPLCDCYLTREEAEAALLREGTRREAVGADTALAEEAEHG